MPKVLLTDISIRALKSPPAGQVTYWDKSLAGFGVRVSQGGTKTFVLVHGATRQRTTIGRHSIISLADARAEAKRILAELTLGKGRPIKMTFDEAKALFLSLHEERNRPRTVADYRRLLGRHFPFGRTQLADIRPEDISRRLDGLKAVPSEARHALVTAKIFFRWAQRKGYIAESPCARLEPRQKLPSRKRVLSDAELTEVLTKATQQPYPFGYIVLLLILTGQRRGEIVGLQWTMIDERLRLITLPETLTKNRRQHTFPYSQGVADILKVVPRQGEYLFPATREHVRNKPTTVFNGWGKAKDELDGTLENVAPWTLHDLRRTFRTNLGQLGVSPHIGERLVNHVTGMGSDVELIYDLWTYLPDMRAAIDLWEAKLASLVKT